MSYEALRWVLMASSALLVILVLANWDATMNLFRSSADQVLDASSGCPIGYEVVGRDSCQQGAGTRFIVILGVFVLINTVVFAFAWLSNEDPRNSENFSWKQGHRTTHNSNSSQRDAPSASGQSRDRTMIRASEARPGDEVIVNGRRFFVSEVSSESGFMQFGLPGGEKVGVWASTYIFLLGKNDSIQRGVTTAADTDSTPGPTSAVNPPRSPSSRVLVTPAEQPAPSLDARTTSATNGEFRDCPYCAEPIRARAIICRFCDRDVSPRA